MKINRFVIIFLVLLFALILVVVFISRGSNSKNQAVFGQQEVNLKIADSPEERQIGLSETRPLLENEGMIFLFDTPGFHSFWMKGMEFPIDIIFLNGDKVVTVHKNIQPPANEKDFLPSYQPTAVSDRVIEVQSGFADKHNVKVGDRVKISL